MNKQTPVVITLNTPIQPKPIKAVTLLQFTDNASAKKVTAYTEELGTITVWQGDDYVAIGDYTQKQLQDRLNEVLSDSK